MPSARAPKPQPNLVMTHQDFGGEPNRKARLEQLWRYTGPDTPTPTPTPVIFKVTVYRDPYEDQSYAKVEVASDARTWTVLATLHPFTWHRATKSTREYVSLADRLLDAAKDTFGIKEE